MVYEQGDPALRDKKEKMKHDEKRDRSATFCRQQLASITEVV